MSDFLRVLDKSWSRILADASLDRGLWHEVHPEVIGSGTIDVRMPLSNEDLPIITCAEDIVSLVDVLFCSSRPTNSNFKWPLQLQIGTSGGKSDMCKHLQGYQ